MVPVRSFTNAVDMIDHYKAVRDRLMNPKPYVPPKPVFVAPKCDELVKHFREVPCSTVHTVFHPRPGIVGARRLVAWIAETHGFCAEDVFGERRSKALTEVRHQAVAAVSLVNPKWSLITLGRFFGGRDHTTILNSLRRMGLIEWPEGHRYAPRQ